MLLLGVYLFSTLSLSWWWLIGLFLAPDLGMLGYLAGNKTGAFTYNVLHHKGMAVILYLYGIYLDSEALQFAGILIFAHASFDRLLGYGLKYYTSFHDTHLGKIGKQNE